MSEAAVSTTESTSAGRIESRRTARRHENAVTDSSVEVISAPKDGEATHENRFFSTERGQMGPRRFFQVFASRARRKQVVGFFTSARLFDTPASRDRKRTAEFGTGEAKTSQIVTTPTPPSRFVSGVERCVVKSESPKVKQAIFSGRGCNLCLLGLSPQGWRWPDARACASRRAAPARTTRSMARANMTFVMTSSSIHGASQAHKRR